MQNNFIEIDRLKYIIIKTIKEKKTSKDIFSQQLFNLNNINNNMEELEVELLLEEISFEFREIWLQYCTKHSSPYFRSPFYEKPIKLPNSKDINYDYERVTSSKFLDKKLLVSTDKVDKWDIDCTFFSSSMSAIHITLSQLFIYVKQNGINIPTVSITQGSYFETIALFRFLHRQGGFNIEYSPYNDILSNIQNGITDIVFLEPVLCNLTQSVLDFDLLIKSIKNRVTNKLLFIIIDSSIVGLSFNMQYILHKIDTIPNLVFIDVSSCLKLYQEGLEFTNAGFSKIYTLKKEYSSDKTHFYSSATNIKKQFSRLRKVYGVGLSLEQFNILDTMWFLDKKCSCDYMIKIHDNNFIIANKLSKINGIFQNVFHPKISNLSQKNWAVSPFIILTFKQEDDTKENMKLIKNIILFESTQLNITLFWGTSFGFRHHRFEINELFNEPYENGQDRHVIRLAIGYRKGFSLEKTFSIFSKIANYKNFTKLRKYYKNIL